MTLTQLQNIVDSLNQAMAASAASGVIGVVSVTVDGITTQYSWDQAQAQLDYWERKLARAKGTKRLISTLDLRGL